MTSDRELERLLDAWFTEGPEQVADRVVDGAAVRIARLPQRAAWRLRPWRFPAMSNPIRMLALTGAILVALLAGALFVVGAVGRPATPTPSPAAVATASPTPASTSTPAASVADWWRIGDCGLCLGRLTPGNQHSAFLRPALTYTVPAGWLNSYDQGDGYQLMEDNQANRACVESQTPTCELLTLNRDMRVGAANCSGDAAPGASLTASRIATALAARPGLTVTKPVEVMVGGLHGLQIDVEVAADWATACPDRGDTPSVATFMNSHDHWASVKGDRSRFILLDIPGAGTIAAGNMLIEVYASSSGDFDAFSKDAMPIVGTFQFAPGG
jgi:hypothetical protein